jgi:thymidylate synthase (FAD)
MISSGVAPEQARMVLPQSMYTSYYVTGSLYAFARAYNLRSDPHAQKEIQDLAATWDEIMKTLFPVSWEALCGDKNGTC